MLLAEHAVRRGGRASRAVLGTGRTAARCVLLVALVIAFGPSAGAASAAEGGAGRQPLAADQPVVDTSGRSLTPADVAALGSQVDDLARLDVAAVVLVRDRDATSDATLEQVEQLQLAWAGAAGVPARDVVAVLVNREPGTDDEARAGVFAGDAVEDLGIDEDERVEVVEDVLLPALADGDVAGGVLATLDRVERTIRFGPPRSAFELWAADEVGAVGAGVAALSLLLLGAALALFRGRARSDASAGAATVARPDDLPPAVGGALVAGGRPDAHALPATLVDLARRWVVALEDADDGEAVQVRLVDGVRPPAGPGAALHGALRGRAVDGVVDAEALSALVGDPSAVHAAVRAEVRDRGWDDATAAGRRGLLASAGLLALLLGVAGVVVAAAAESAWPGLAGAGVGLAVGAGVLVLAALVPLLSSHGQVHAARWEAYRDGLAAAAEGAAGHDGVAVGDVLADVVALGLGSAWEDRVADDPAALRALAGGRGRDGEPSAAAVVSWPVLLATTAPSTAAGGAGMATSVGAAGGGGAAGST